MKSTAHQPMTRTPACARRARPDGVKADHSRAQQRQGAYKRFEIFLGLEAAIALRSLMRDGRSTREVIEALLLDERQRRQKDFAPKAGRAR